MATLILSDRTNPIDQSTRNTNLESDPNTLVRSYDLISYHYLPKVNEAICTVRDQTTGVLRKAFGSHLHIFWSGVETPQRGLGESFGKDAYLLELIRGGNQ